APDSLLSACARQRPERPASRAAGLCRQYRISGAGRRDRPDADTRSRRRGDGARSCRRRRAARRSRAEQSVTRILVTGARGFVGRALVAERARDHSVRAAVRRRPEPPLDPQVNVITAPDLADEPDWNLALNGVEAVVHLAGIAHVGSDIPDASYDRVNHVA